jgi:6,7-dimethyl-8-ribityllumazine synthase
MSTFQGQSRAAGRVALVVSRYHERITSHLLEGAERACEEAGVSSDNRDVLWVSGAFELGVVVAAAAHGGKYAAIVALGAVIRGETPHFEYVAGETAAALARTATESLVPIGFGLLTCETVAQAEARAGGSGGNKGHEAAEAALRTADLIRQALEE